MRSVEENSPELANEWGPDNGSFTPQNVSYGSNKSIQWIGKCGHTWITSPKARAHGEGCPYCAGKKVLTGFNDLKSQYPELAEEWSDKNELHPDMVTTGSSKKVWWKCHICGYEWRAVIKNRVGGSGCPNCVNRILIKGKNDFATLHPDKALDWSEKNVTKKPNMFLEFSNYRAWWKCHVCGYEWQAPIANRSGGSECMCCSGMRLEAGINDLATTNPELSEEWSVQNGDLTPAMYKENSREMIWWTCRECGNEWRASIYSRSRGRICPYCSEKIRRENSVFRYRYRRDMMRFENNIRTAVIRFYMKKYGICVEYDTEELIGVSLDLYFPEEKGVLILSKDFHENLQGRRIEHAKNEMVRKKGLRLIRILEPGFRSFDDCACISCADDTLESFDQALEVAMESFGVDMDIDTERDMREIFVNYQNYLETGA